MKKNLINIFLVLFLIILPLIVLIWAQNDIRVVEGLQNSILVFILVGSILLTYLNYKNQKQALKNKWWWIVFEVIGILGICYSVFIILILFLFRNIGF